MPILARKYLESAVLTACFEQLNGQGPCLGRYLVSRQHSRNFANSVFTLNGSHRCGGGTLRHDLLNHEVMIGFSRDRRQMGYRQHLLLTPDLA